MGKKKHKRSRLTHHGEGVVSGYSTGDCLALRHRKPADGVNTTIIQQGSQQSQREGNQPRSAMAAAEVAGILWTRDLRCSFCLCSFLLNAAQLQSLWSVCISPQYHLCLHRLQHSGQPQVFHLGSATSVLGLGMLPILWVGKLRCVGDRELIQSAPL